MIHGRGFERVWVSSNAVFIASTYVYVPSFTRMLCLSSTNAATEMLRLKLREKASIKTFRFSDLLSATMGSSVSKKKRRNRSLYALSVLFLVAYFTVSASRTSHAHVRGKPGRRHVALSKLHACCGTVECCIHFLIEGWFVAPSSLHAQPKIR